MDARSNPLTYGTVKRPNFRRVVRRLVVGLALAGVCAWALYEAGRRVYWYERDSVVATLEAIPGVRVGPVTGFDEDFSFSVIDAEVTLGADPPRPGRKGRRASPSDRWTLFAPAAELPYQLSPRWHTRRVLRRIVMPIVLLLVVGAAFTFGPPLYRHTQSLCWQRQCMTYTAVPGRVAYSDDPADLPSLLGTGGYDTNALSAGPSRYVILRNGAWKQYAGKALPQVFMHRRRSPGSNDRLVVVQFATFRGRAFDAFDLLVFTPYVERPSTVFSRTTGSGSGPAQLQMLRAPGEGTRVVEGLADRQDPFHFTIDYVHNGTAGTVDGWLNDDESVTLSPRSGTYVEVTPGFAQWSPAGTIPAGLSAAEVKDAATRPGRTPSLTVTFTGRPRLKFAHLAIAP